MDHPNESELAAAAAGDDRRGSEKMVPDHVAAGCGECARAVALWRRVAESMRAVAGEGPPPREAVLRAESIFAPPANPAPRPGPFPILAELRFDSLRRPQPAAARSCTVAERHLLYSVRGFDIDMRIRISRGGLSLSGQILPDEGGFVDPSRLQVRHHGPEGRTASLAVTEYGEFGARELRSGEQVLEIVLDDLDSCRLGFEL